MPASGIDWLTLTMGLLGGLALFLLGLDRMTHGLKKLAGDGLRAALGRLTTNRFSGALTGAFVTAAVNSSSVTTVLVVGFVTAGIMNLQQSVGVIMGANIGSTVTAQLVAFDLGAYSLGAIALGFALSVIRRRRVCTYGGEMLLGLGLVFYGMDLMGTAMVPLRSYEPFLDLMARMDQPLLGALIGAVFTALVQSSAATTGIAIAMASQGVLSLPAGIALALGANVGTCVTALLAAIGKPREAVQAAMVHVIFNVLGVLLWLPLIGVLVDVATALSPAADPGESPVPRQIANAHTLFNIINTLLFIGFTGPIARLVQRLVPDRPPPAAIEPRFLDPDLITLPPVALLAVRQELGHLGEVVQQAIERLRAQRADKRWERLQTEEKQIDDLQRAILRYLGQIRQGDIDGPEATEFQQLVVAAHALEAAGDILTEDLPDLMNKNRHLPVSETMLELARNLGQHVAGALHEAIVAVRERDPTQAEAVLARKQAVAAAIDATLAHQASTLVDDSDERLAVVRHEASFVELLKRLYSEAKRLARSVLVEDPDMDVEVAKEKGLSESKADSA